jgi:hypothetical protein
MKRFASRLHWRGALRVLGLLLALNVLAIGLSARAAHARMGELLLGVGDQLMQLPGARAPEQTRSLFLNGLELRLRSTTSDLPVAAVLDHFQGICRSRSGIQAPAAVLKDLHARAGDSPATRAWFDGVQRVESESQGALACLDTGGALSLDELAARFADFGKTGDVSAIGALRYVLARRVAGKTAVLLLWTDGALRVASAFPAQGDAPGVDPADIPRPDGTRRLLSSWESGEPYSINVYASERTPQVLLDVYRTELEQAGFALHRPNAAAETTLLAERGARTIVVRASAARKGGSRVSIAALSAP